MSRRRVSVKDLGVLDCQGWLHRRKEGRSFLGSKWKRYWFVLQKSSLYWYTNQMADKAEGFINLSGFTIEQAKQCRKKHAITASHPLVVTIFIAAETFTEMNKWISKLSEAAASCDTVDTKERYSEGSDQDEDETVSTCSQDPEHETAESENVGVAQPVGESLPCSSTPPSTVNAGERGRSLSDGDALSRSRIKAASDDRERLSWPNLSRPDGADGAAPAPLIHIGEENEKEAHHETTPDEMERLYKHLKEASLSLTGEPGQRDFRLSFIRRCPNDKVNEKLHLLRILRSTLKSKESDLQLVDQILSDPTLTASTYRSWRLSNHIVQQISGGSRAAQTPREQTSD